jgi:hemerythrin-like domain-containing protein
MHHYNDQEAMMGRITDFLSKDHERCDQLFLQAESNAQKGQWEAATTMFRMFQNSLERHLSIEEEILFPAMGEILGVTCGPTDVMRSEHRQMRQLVRSMDEAVTARNREEFLGNAETLLIMMQQHNFKEENMLYRMADQMLAQRPDEIIAAMENIKELT